MLSTARSTRSSPGDGQGPRRPLVRPPPRRDVAPGPQHAGTARSASPPSKLGDRDPVDDRTAPGGRGTAAPAGAARRRPRRRRLDRLLSVGDDGHVGRRFAAVRSAATRCWSPSAAALASRPGLAVAAAAAARARRHAADGPGRRAGAAALAATRGGDDEPRPRRPRPRPPPRPHRTDRRKWRDDRRRQGPDGIAVSDGRVFVANQRATTLSVDRRRDRTSSPASRWTSASRPDGVVAGKGVVWVGGRRDGHRAQRIQTQPEPTRRPAKVKVGDRPEAISLGKQLVWVANRNDGTVNRHRPRASPGVVGTPIGVGNEPAGHLRRPQASCG